MPYRTYFLVLVFVAASASAQADVSEIVSHARRSGKADEALISNISAGSDWVHVIVSLEKEPLLKPAIAAAKSKKDKEESRKQLVKSLKHFAKRSQDRVLEHLSENDFRIKYRFATLNGFSGYVSPEGLEKLLDNPAVKSVESVRKAVLHLDESVHVVNASSVWNLQVDAVNVTGRDQSVCVVDTGVDYTHSALGGCSEAEFLAGNCGKVPWGYDYGIGDSNPIDDDADGGHGTHVAGIVASTDSTYPGVAPDAKIIAMKVFSGSGAEYGAAWDDIQSAVEACYLNASTYNISVITMSLGTASYSHCGTCDSALGSSFVEALENADYYGLVIDVSSGNEGRNYGIAAPACSQYAYSVGATYDENIGSTGTFSCGCSDSSTSLDKVACYSNRCDNLDVWAPGSLITSSVVGDDYDHWHGTSMAAPHVAGAVALIQEYAVLMNGSLLTPDQVKDALSSTGKLVTRDVTKPRIKVRAAIDSLNFKPPKLANPSVSPNGGNTSEVFNFTVTYSDQDNDAPSYVRVYIDGSQNSMTSTGTDYRGGVVYYYESTLSEGPHEYYFTASDAVMTNTSATQTDLDVNYAPDIVGASVTPSLGSTSTLYNFTAAYSDQDSDPVVSAALTVDGTEYEAEEGGSDVYYYNVTLASTGTHNFVFAFSDGNYTVSSAASGPSVYDDSPECYGVDPSASPNWDINSYTNCTGTAVLPTSTRYGYVNITAGGTLNLSQTYLYVNNTLAYVDGVLVLDSSELRFLR